MGLVRRALMAATGVEPAIRERLLVQDYAEPRGLVPEIPFVHGELERVSPADPPPIMHGGDVELEWNNPPPVATRSDDGEVTLTFDYKITYAKLPPT